jgi:F0F1-type ATP synthase membrane subunit b/b'
MVTKIHLIPDKTFFVQFGIFLVVLTGLYFFIFRPVVRIILLRRQKTSGLLEKSKAFEEKLGELAAGYNAEISSAREEGLKKLEATVKAAAVEAASIRDSARKDAAGLAQEAAKKILASKERTLSDLRSILPGVVDQIIKKVT